MSKFKRFLALAAMILVFMSVLVVPVMAYTVVDGADTSSLVPLWNISRVEVFYLSGQVAAFDFPTDWFGSSEEVINLTIAYDDPNDDSNSLQFTNISHFDYQNGFYAVSFNFPCGNATRIRFYYSDTYIPYRSLGSDPNDFIPFSVYGDDISVTFDYNFNSAHVVRDANNNIVSRYNDPISFTDISYYSDSYGYALVPYDSLINDSVVRANDLANGTTNYDRLLYFSNCFSEIVFNSPSSSQSLSFRMPLIDYSESLTGSSWIYYNLPRDISYIPDDEFTPLSGIGTFLSTVLGGFLAFEFFPGFSVGVLFVSILGILCIIAFLRWFAGG